MRVFLDTNIWISLFIGSGSCIDLVEYCRFEHSLLTSETVLKEVRSVLKAKFHYSHSEVELAISFIQKNAELTKDKPSSMKTNCRDKADEAILLSALAAKTTVIITGDQDLLALSGFEGIKILTPSQFWHYEKFQSAD